MTAHRIAATVLLLPLLAGVNAGPSFAQSAGGAKPTPVDELPEVKGLPNPFAAADGSTVGGKDGWEKRRAELKSLFETVEYGHLPPKPEAMDVARGEVKPDDAAQADRQDLEVTLKQGEKSLVLHVSLTLPRGAKGPFPVVVQGGFGRPAGARPANAPAKDVPAKKAFVPRPDRHRIFTDRGYAVAEIPLNEVAADNKDRARSSGVYQLFGDDIDCGALMAWAWGVSRVIDAIEADPRIDAKKIVVTGHSRYGKMALIAGAFDERIALTVPSHSGAGGAAPYRFIFGKSEQLQNIAGAFPYWFRPDFHRFVGRVDRLPIDQHELKALVAPRALLSTEGTQDAWTNPEGSQLTYLAAKKVYAFLGVPDRISIRFRPVGHVPSNEDLLEFADHVFFGKPLADAFGKLEYPEPATGIDWDAPK